MVNEFFGTVISYPSTKSKTLHLVEYSDGSFATNEDSFFPQGNHIPLGAGCASECALSISSMKYERIVPSVLKTEIFAFAATANEAIFL